MPAYAALSMPSFSVLRKGWIWSTFVAYARSTIMTALDKGVQEGLIEIVDCDGTTRKFEACGQTSRHGLLTVHDETFWVRVYFPYDIGSFMNGDISSPSMKDIFNIYVDNYPHMSGVRSLSYNIKLVLDVIVAGYDTSNKLYKAFLSREIQYSCPIWGDEEGGVRGDLTGQRTYGDLERAQERKIDYVLKKARLRPGHRLLEIGSGWGSLAIAATQLGCTVESLALSIEQKTLAEERIRKAGFKSQVRIHLTDYREMPPDFEKAFDTCIALEMIEAVGVAYMPTFIKTVDWALKDRNAAVVLSATATPMPRDEFIRKYHWPHVIPPSATWLAHQFHTVLRGCFSLDSCEDHASRKHLEENWTPDLILSLQKRYPEFLDTHSLNVYERRWLYMLVYMEVAYSRVWLTLHYWTFYTAFLSGISCDRMQLIIG
ncbi:S-adenosyl-L-methionine-dependent methyltransferase [Desarmillaria ectypa]|nr:S-adenosyl-L-methionine-dependent methyltransferase [Desarmillaria ectypa]